MSCPSRNSFKNAVGNLITELNLSSSVSASDFSCEFAPQTFSDFHLATFGDDSLYLCLNSQIQGYDRKYCLVVIIGCFYGIIGSKLSVSFSADHTCNINDGAGNPGSNCYSLISSPKPLAGHIPLTNNNKSLSAYAAFFNEIDHGYASWDSTANSPCVGFSGNSSCVLYGETIGFNGSPGDWTPNYWIGKNKNGVSCKIVAAIQESDIKPFIDGLYALTGSIALSFGSKTYTQAVGLYAVLFSTDFASLFSVFDDCQLHIPYGEYEANIIFEVLRRTAILNVGYTKFLPTAGLYQAIYDIAKAINNIPHLVPQQVQENCSDFCDFEPDKPGNYDAFLKSINMSNYTYTASWSVDNVIRTETRCCLMDLEHYCTTPCGKTCTTHPIVECEKGSCLSTELMREFTWKYVQTTHPDATNSFVINGDCGSKIIGKNHVPAKIRLTSALWGTTSGLPTYSYIGFKS